MNVNQCKGWAEGQKTPLSLCNLVYWASMHLHCGVSGLDAIAGSEGYFNKIN